MTQFTEEEVQEVNNPQMPCHSADLKMQIKITMKYHCVLMKEAKITLSIVNGGKDK